MVSGVVSYNVELLGIKSVKCSKITNIQSDKIWLLVGCAFGFQTDSMISLERTVYKIKNKMHS